MDNSFLDVYAEQTPNPETMKFVFNRNILDSEPLEFTTSAEAAKSPLARNLFEFSFVNGVFIMNNFVTITRVEGNEWDDIIPIVKEFLKAYISAGEPVILETSKVEFVVSDDPIVAKIQEILETYVRPAVEIDGGMISFKSFDEGRVTVQLQGSCSGCPSSSITLKRGIEGMLTRMVPEVKEVVAEEI